MALLVALLVDVCIMAIVYMILKALPIPPQFTNIVLAIFLLICLIMLLNTIGLVGSPWYPWYPRH